MLTSVCEVKGSGQKASTKQKHSVLFVWSAFLKAGFCLYLAQFFILNGNCLSSVFESNLASVLVLTEEAKHHGLCVACEFSIWMFLLAWVTEDLLEFLGMFHHPPNSLGSEANKSNSLDQPGTRHPGKLLPRTRNNCLAFSGTRLFTSTLYFSLCFYSTSGGASYQASGASLKIQGGTSSDN